MPYFCDLSSLTVLQVSFAFNPYQIDGFYTFWLCIGDKASAPDPNSQHRGRYCSVTRSQNKVIKMATPPQMCAASYTARALTNYQSAPKGNHSKYLTLPTRKMTSLSVSEVLVRIFIILHKVELSIKKKPFPVT